MSNRVTEFLIEIELFSGTGNYSILDSLEIVKMVDLTLYYT